MAFIKKRLLIRYLIYKDPGAYGENYETVAARVFFVSSSHNLAYETISLEYSQTVSNHAVYPKKPLSVQASWGDEAHVEQKLQGILKPWSAAAAAGLQLQRYWLQPEEFVGVLRVGDEYRTVDAAAPLFMLLHGILAARIAEHGERLQNVKGLEARLTLLADAMERMGSRFSAFATQNHHAMANKMIPYLMEAH